MTWAAILLAALGVALSAVSLWAVVEADRRRDAFVERLLDRFLSRSMTEYRGPSFAAAAVDQDEADERTEDAAVEAFLRRVESAATVGGQE